MVVVSNTNSFAKEMNIRRRISSIYNKREDDFSSLKEFNDYLEEVEDMICNLVDGINVPEIEARIATYEKENAEQIINSRARKAEEVAAALAAVSVKTHAAQSDDNGVVSNQSSQLGSTSTGQGQYAPSIAGTAFGQPRPTGIAPQPLPFGGSRDIDEGELMRLRAERGGLAGGWTPDMSRKRALEEAFGSLWI